MCNAPATCRSVGPAQRWGLPAAANRSQPVEADDEEALLKRMLELLAEFPRFGDRQIGRLLRQEGFQVNIKRIDRIPCERTELVG